MYNLYIDGKNTSCVIKVLCEMPDWELQQHTDVEKAYVMNEGDDPKMVSVYDLEKKCFVRCKK